MMHGITNQFIRLTFLTLFSVILAYSHYFLYFSLTRFIDFQGRENVYLASVLGVLSVSFMLTTICAGYWDNRKTRYAYYLASVWLGFLHYITISFAIVWGIAFILEKLEVFFPLGLLGAIGGTVAIFTALYGLSNARSMRITRVDVSIRDLPASWEGKKIAHISDVHIGHILRSGFVRRIAKKINLEKPEVVCITGDLLDGMDGRLEHLVDPLGTIEAPHGVLYVDGNHETYLGVERAFASLRATRARILRDEIVTLDGLDFIGVDYPEPGVRKDIAETIKALENFDPKKPSVLLFHTPFQIEAIAETGVDLELCGHTHRGQLWPFGYVTRFIFRGRDYGLTTIGDYSLYTSSGIGTWGPPLRVGSKSEIAMITLHRKS